MAKQLSQLKLAGTIGGITYFKSRDGYIAKEKTHLSKERIATDPKFKRTRENGLEFSSSGKSSKLLRNAFRVLIQRIGDRRLFGRLTKEMLKVVQSDVVNERGSRQITNGQLTMLEGFEFNTHCSLGSSFGVTVTSNIDRSSGIMTIDVPVYTPSLVVNAPEGATHYKLLGAGAELDFKNDRFLSQYVESDFQTFNNALTQAFSLKPVVTAGSTSPLFLCMGIEFYQFINGNYYALNNEAFNALSLLKVSTL